jgi:hypothetical protein
MPKMTKKHLKNNIILDYFKEPSENLKNFIVKYKLWYYHTTRVNPYNDDELLKSLSRAIMKEKKDREYLFFSSDCAAYRLKIEIHNVFFYGNKDQVKEKVSDYLLKTDNSPFKFFAVYDFVDDHESEISYGSNCVDGKIEIMLK